MPMASDDQWLKNVFFEDYGLRLPDLTAAVKIGQAIGCLLPASPHPVLVGKCTARENYVIEMWLVGALLHAGKEVVQTGPISAPGVAALTDSMRADLGVFISGGRKDGARICLFTPKGRGSTAELSMRLQALLESEVVGMLSAEPAKATRIEDAQARYIEMVKAQVPNDLRFDGIRIALDCQNGACYKTARAVLHELGAEVLSYGVHPNGVNLRTDAKENRKFLQEEVRKFRCNYGLGIDVDGAHAYLIDAQRKKPYPDELYRYLESVKLTTASSIDDPFVRALQILAAVVRAKNGRC